LAQGHLAAEASFAIAVIVYNFLGICDVIEYHPSSSSYFICCYSFTLIQRCSQKNSKNWSNNLLQNCWSFGCHFIKTADPARVFDQRSSDSEYFQKSEIKVL
jgi:hypothetical protein